MVEAWPCLSNLERHHSRDVGFVIQRRRSVRVTETRDSVVTHPEHIRLIFKDSDQHTKAINNNSGWLMSQLLGDCLGLISGSRWGNLHTVISKSFTNSKATSCVPQIMDAVSAHFDHLEKSGRLDRNRIDPVKDLRILPFWIIAEIMYGKLSNIQREQLKTIIPTREALFSRMVQGGITRSSWSRYLPTETNKSLRRFKRQWADFNRQAYLASCSRGDQTLIVTLYEAVKSGTVSSEEVLQTLDEILFANLDVTMGGLSWNLLFLAAHENIQDTIRKEVTANTNTRNGAPTMIAEDYIGRSNTMLNASILESARLKPLAAFSVPQSAPSDRIVGGFRIPAGTNIIVDTHALNIRNGYWGDDGHEFRPQRFLERNMLEMRYQYWRFGFGPRQCLGKYVIDRIIRAVLAHLLVNYRLNVSDETRWDKNQETWIAQPNTEVRCERLA